jgi:enoyl-CoA hydratase
VLNALSLATLDDLRQAFQELKNDSEVRVAIITGEGDKAFVAGADIQELTVETSITGKEYCRRGHTVFDLIENLGKPVIAAINGFALGGGCELAMACTIRIAIPNAKFGQPEVKLGIIPGFNGTQRLPRIVGKGVAMQLLLTGDIIPAEEAYRIGLVNEIVAPAELMARAEALAKKMIANAPLAVRFAMEAVNHGLEVSIQESCARPRTKSKAHALFWRNARRSSRASNSACSGYLTSTRQRQNGRCRGFRFSPQQATAGLS